MLDLIDEGKIGWDKICELGQVLIGENRGPQERRTTSSTTRATPGSASSSPPRAR